MKRQTLAMSLVIILLMGAAPVWAILTGDADTLLTEEEAAKLPVEARKLYQQAVEAFNHVNRDGGVHLLDQAAKAAPENLAIQFVIVDRARARAHFQHGPKALEYFDIAEQAVQRILAQSELTLEEKRRAEEKMNMIRTERENLPANEKKKMDLGFKAIVFPKALERAKTSGIQVDDILAKKAALEKGATAGPGGALPAFKPISGFAVAPAAPATTVLPGAAAGTYPGAVPGPAGLSPGAAPAVPAARGASGPVFEPAI